MKDINHVDWARAEALATRVSFIRTKSEFRAYTRCIYDAIQWGKHVR